MYSLLRFSNYNDQPAIFHIPTHFQASWITLKRTPDVKEFYLQIGQYVSLQGKDM